MNKDLIDRLDDRAEFLRVLGNDDIAALLDEARAAIEAQSVPADCDARKIMLAVVPGEEGMGHEVYAKNINEVEAKLSEMGERLEEWELGIRSLKAPQPAQPAQPCIACGVTDGHSNNCARVRWGIDSAPQPAQPVQEPVAWLVCSVNSDGSLSLEHAAAWEEAAHEHINDAITEHEIDGAASWVVRPAYTSPQAQPAQPEQEPVAHFGSAYINENGVHITTVLGPVAIPQDAELYTTPQAQPAQPLSETVIYTPGEWFYAATVDLMHAFYEHRLPAIRDAAKEHGYAIGVHGSMRRDFDLIAAPWRDDASDADTLAHALAMAACGIARAGTYNWEQKPAGRVATCIPICWSHRHGVPSDGHIDLSVMPQQAQPAQPAPDGYVRLPTNADEADAMLRAGYVYLHAHAPERLKKEPQAQPLSDGQILSHWAGDTPRPVLGKNKVIAFARAIEAAHGIKDQS